MRRLYSEKAIKRMARITNGQASSIKTYNDGLQVDESGDVTVGRDLYMEDEIVIDHLGKIVDPEGNPFIPNLPADAATSTYALCAVNGVLNWVKQN